MGWKRKLREGKGAFSRLLKPDPKVIRPPLTDKLDLGKREPRALADSLDMGVSGEKLGPGVY